MAQMPANSDDAWIDALLPPAKMPECGAVAIGNFDGVHQGHQAVLSPVLEMAQQLTIPTTLLSFEPHPRDFFAPEKHLFRLTSPRHKARLARAMGFDTIILAPFDKALAATPAEQFVDDILIRHMKAKAVSVGFDFQFGAKRAGTPEMLKQRAEALGALVHIAPAFKKSELIVSSSAIRQLLREQKLGAANQLMGHRLEMDGVVVHGDKRGRELGMPTANIRVDPTCDLAHGIYAVEACLDGEDEPNWISGVANFGTRPMFETKQALLEVHLFDFDREIYDQNLRVRFIDFLRPEARFDGLDALVEQMNNDANAAKIALDEAQPISALDSRVRALK